MKSKFLLALTALILALPFAAGSAQDIGDIDSIIVDCPAVTPTVIVGDSIAVPIYSYNDDYMHAFSLGFRYDSDFIEYSSSKLSPLITGGQVFPLISAANNTVLLGWTDLSSQFQLAPSTSRQLIITLYFKVLPGATSAKINLDSTFVPPSGAFVTTISADGGIETFEIVPGYLDCGTADIHLPIQEYGGPVLPDNYALSQNNPNPFNPNTMIEFALPRAAKTTIEIFNILGQKVTTLVDEYLAAGHKRIEWNGTDASGNQVASGIYLYRMTANDYTETRKMMLMK